MWSQSGSQNPKVTKEKDDLKGASSSCAGAQQLLRVVDLTQLPVSEGRGGRPQGCEEM